MILENVDNNQNLNENSYLTKETMPIIFRYDYNINNIYLEKISTSTSKSKILYVKYKVLYDYDIVGKYKMYFLTNFLQIENPIKINGSNINFNLILTCNNIYNANFLKMISDVENKILEKLKTEHENLIYNKPTKYTINSFSYKEQNNTDIYYLMSKSKGGEKKKISTSNTISTFDEIKNNISSLRYNKNNTELFFEGKFLLMFDVVVYYVNNEKNLKINIIAKDIEIKHNKSFNKIENSNLINYSKKLCLDKLIL